DVLDLDLKDHDGAVVLAQHSTVQADAHGAGRGDRVLQAVDLDCLADTGDAVAGELELVGDVVAACAEGDENTLDEHEHREQAGDDGHRDVGHGPPSGGILRRRLDGCRPCGRLAHRTLTLRSSWSGSDCGSATWSSSTPP